jgi:hypothetical protein
MENFSDRRSDMSLTRDDSGVSLCSAVPIYGALDKIAETFIDGIRRKDHTH